MHTVPVRGRLWLAGNSSRLAWLHSRCYGRRAVPDVELSHSPREAQGDQQTFIIYTAESTGISYYTIPVLS